MQSSCYYSTGTRVVMEKSPLGIHCSGSSHLIGQAYRPLVTLRAVPASPHGRIIGRVSIDLEQSMNLDSL